LKREESSHGVRALIGKSIKGRGVIEAIIREGGGNEKLAAAVITFIPLPAASKGIY
jgi:hypothetical protein